MKHLFPLLIAISMLIAGCATGKAIPEGKPIAFSSPRSTLLAVGVNTDEQRVLQNTAKVTITSPDRKVVFRLAVITQAPDRLRLESIPVFGPPDFVFVTQDKQFQIYQPAAGAFLTGMASSENLSHVLPISLAWPAERWVAVLQGRPPLREDITNITGEMETSFYRIDLAHENKTSEQLWINRQNGHLEKMAFFNPEGQASTILYSQFKDVEGKDRPECMDIDAGNGTKIRIVYESMEIRQDAGDDLFTLQPPPDTAVQTLPD